MKKDLKIFRKVVADEVLKWTYLGLLEKGEKYKILYKEGFHTGGWLYAPPHRIFLGSATLEASTPALAAEKGRAFLCHELCHYKWTQKDMGKIQLMLATSRAPFELYNLFEDGRIEHRYRAVTGLRFNWLKHLPFEFTATPTPGELLLLIIQMETIPKWEWYYKNVPKELCHKVEDYYHKICEATDTLALEPILADWQAEFANQPVRGGDLQFTVQFMNAKPEDRQRLIADFEKGTVSADDESEQKKAKRKLVFQDIDVSTLTVDKNGEFLSKSVNTPIDPLRVQELTRRLELLLGAGGGREVNVTTREPGKRLSMRHIARGEVRYQTKTRSSSPVLKLTLIFDCSGSMDEEPLWEGVHLLAALNVLAKKGKIVGAVVLSKIENERLLQETIPLPFADDIPSRILADGDGEGLYNAIIQNRKLVKENGNVFVYTDANIGDSPLKAENLSKWGIKPIGLFVDDGQESSEAALARMAVHFEHFFVRSTIESLVETLVQRKALLSYR